jgi:hypothetical protein
MSTFPYGISIQSKSGSIASKRSSLPLPLNAEKFWCNALVGTGGSRNIAFKGKGSEDLFDAIEPDLDWIEIPYGKVLIFNQNLPHGNRINREHQTRWSMNCRFKSVFSPYGDKKLGEFFEPVTLRIASRIGMDYEYPEV